MSQRDPRVTAYIQQAAPFARPILRQLRQRIHQAGPALEETIKWGMPTFLHRGKIVCGLGAFKAHCALWFWKGDAVVAAKAKEAMGQFGRIEDLADLPAAADLQAHVRHAVERIELTATRNPRR